MKNKHWAILFAVIILLCALCSIPLFRSQTARQVQITSNGTPVATLDLNQNQELTIPASNGGYNIVTIQNGAIAVTFATCPDHYCMDRGFCSGGTQIVCLPNRLVIAFLGDQEVDGMVG